MPSSDRRDPGVTAGSQAMLVVEYPCAQFCRVEVDLSGERGHATLDQMRQKADETHRRIHEPESTEGDTPAEAGTPAVDESASGRPAPTVFLSAPGRGAERRR